MQELKNKAIAAMGFDRLNPMQEQMLETAASGQNTLLLSPTGSGKTVAFLLPLMAQAENVSIDHRPSSIDHRPSSIDHRPSSLRALILVPSRELAQQIGEVARKLGIRIVVCYGGHDIRIENDRLSAISNEKGSYMIVSTSGRCKDHMERERIDGRIFTHLVLDEYDKSLELGFEEEMKFIVGKLTGLKQRILTSATHAMPIVPWLNMKPYAQINSQELFNKADNNVCNNSLPKEGWGGSLWQVKSPIADKLETLKALVLNIFAQPNNKTTKQQNNADKPTNAAEQLIIFSNYRESSERIAHFLSDNGIQSALYHGGLDQNYRDKALIRFRQQSVRILVSTDLASRGLDIDGVAHVIHYHLPADEEAFIHRNGRTARAGAPGNAYLIIGPTEFVPEYVGKEPPFFAMKSLDSNLNNTTTQQQNNAEGHFATVYIGRGKKEKISKGDIVGFFTRNGGIDGSQIGRIDVMEHCAYCAINAAVVHEVLRKVQGLKIKGEKTIYKIV